MRANAPTQMLWIIAAILGGLGILARYVKIQQVSPYAFELVAVGFVLLVISTRNRRL